MVTVDGFGGSGRGENQSREGASLSLRCPSGVQDLVVLVQIEEREMAPRGRRCPSKLGMGDAVTAAMLVW